MRPRILLTNDDGYQALGLHRLIDVFREGADLFVVAPLQEMSGVGHAITIRQPLLEKKCLYEGLEIYAISGTPADCVKLAYANIMNEQIDLVVSGINQGSNTGVNIFYSGTASAAMEAALLGIPALAVSLASYTSANFGPAAHYAQYVAEMILRDGLPKRVFLNMNVPNLPIEDIKGIQLTRQGPCIYKDEYVAYSDPRGNRFYWLHGNRLDIDPEPDEDDAAISEGWISITPVQAALTADFCMGELKTKVAALNLLKNPTGIK